MEFLKSQKGKQKLAFEGYMYIYDRKHNFRYEHLWNHDFYAQESNIIFDIFFRYFFDIISIFFSMFSMFFSIFFFDYMSILYFVLFDVLTFRSFVVSM